MRDEDLVKQPNYLLRKCQGREKQEEQYSTKLFSVHLNTRKGNLIFIDSNLYTINLACQEMKVFLNVDSNGPCQ